LKQHAELLRGAELRRYEESEESHGLSYQQSKALLRRHL